jgi:hypothetical protein
LTVPRFFARVHAAVGRHLAIDSATLEQRLETVTIGVQCAPARDRNAAWIAELLVNQLARLYPRLCIYGDDGMTETLRSIASSINPQIELSQDPGDATTLVSVIAPAPDGALTVSASGWSALLGEGPSRPGGDEDANPFAAAAGAALAASAVFRRVLLKDDSAWAPAHLDLLHPDGGATFETERLAPLDLGSVLVAGVGAVGNAALWALARHPHLTGRAFVVDPEVVELSNLQRYVLTTDTDVGHEKTELAARVLATTALKVELVRGRLGEVRVPEDVENTLVTVDNIFGRRVAQALLPRLAVSGWTSESGLGASWHDFREGAACLSCLYQPSGPAPSQIDFVARSLGLASDRAAILWLTPEVIGDKDAETIAEHLGADAGELAPWIGKQLQLAYTKLVCGSAAISIGERGRIETVPLAHQSVLAGVLAATELIKRADPSMRVRLPEQNLIAWHDVTRTPPKIWTQRRGQEPGCICSDADYREVFREKWSDQSS